MNLKRKVAIVTGASDGLGKQIVLKLAKEGVSLALVARRKDVLDEVRRQVEKNGGSKTVSYPCDIRDSLQIKETVAKIISDFRKVNILINCAGIWQKLNLLEDISEEEVESVIRADLTGHIHFTRLMIPHLRQAREAAIINVSSKSGVTAQPGQSVYSAAKWGMTGFTEALKVDLAGTIIRVAGLYQGGVDTGMFRKAGEHLNQDKFIKPEDLADVVVFMLSRPESIWLHDVRVEY